MSEPTIPFQGPTAVLDRPEAAPDPDVAEAGNRTKLLALGGLAAVVVLGLVAYFLLFAGGSDPAPVPATDGGAPAAAPAVPAPAAPAPAAKPVKLTAKSFGRDPFTALISAPVANAAPAADGTAVAATDPAATGTSTGSTAPATTTGSTTTGSTGSTGTGTTTPNPSTSHSFKVVKVAADNRSITVRVDGTSYKNLNAGEVFAEYFKVVLISGQVNAFQFGEEKFNVIGTKKLTIA